MSTINSSVTSIQTSINSIITSVTSMDDSLSGFLTYVNYPAQYGNMALRTFFGIMIGFSSLALLGALLTVCCRKFGCRHLMYFSCIFLFLGALVGFIISTLFSVMVPAFTWTCTYLGYTLASSANFQSKYMLT
jgi:tetrahydromethanopterin S-methyltransferase subunit B